MDDHLGKYQQAYSDGAQHCITHIQQEYGRDYSLADCSGPGDPTL
jgi:hypothetical protein